MTIPATGTSYSGAGLNVLDSRFLERGKLQNVLIRDARGTATDISPHNSDGTVRWSPFAQDGKWRADLFAFKRVNGVWLLNTDPNEGFHRGGAFKEGQGPASKPNVKNDDFMIEQSNMPFDTDLTSEGEPFSFTAVETANPFIRRLRNNLRLNDDNGNVLVELPGTPNAGWSRPLDGDNIDRQVLLVREIKKTGLAMRKVEGFSLAKLSDIGNSKYDKKDSEAAELTYQPLPDGIFMAVVDGEYRPIIKHTWVGGPAWLALSTEAGNFAVTLGSQSSGQFTLTFGGNTTAPIAYNATSSAVKSALVALDDGFSASDWVVTGSAGGPYTITTPGGQFGVLTGDGTSLGTPGTFVINPVTP